MKKKKYAVFVVVNGIAVQTFTKSYAKNSIKIAITNNRNLATAKALDYANNPKPRNTTIELRQKFVSKFKRLKIKDTSAVIKRQFNNMDILLYHC